MSGHTFISYSRQQYYFAESLTLHLQQRGLPVWFDLQQIEPGVDWKADIQDGLNRAESVTLVASRAALRSPYVAQEWQYALDAHKPVYVARYERVRLPDALRRGATVIDFRGDFARGVDALAACLAAPPSGAGRAAVTPGGGGSGLPRGVRRMALALGLHDLTEAAAPLLGLLALSLLATPGTLPRVVLDRAYPQAAEQLVRWLTMGLLILGALVVAGNILPLPGLRQQGKAWRFLRHDFEYEALLAQLRRPASLGLALTGLALLGINALLIQTDLAGRFLQLPGGLARPGYEPLLALAGGALALLLARLPIRWLTPRTPDPDVIRWAVLGAVPQAWRLEVNRPLMADPAAAQAALPVEVALQQAGRPGESPSAPAPAAARAPLPDAPLTVRLVAGPLDDKPKRQVASVLARAGIREALPGDEAAYTALILTYRTPAALALETARAAQEAGRGVIGVMATNVTLPPELLDLQIIDYRDGATLPLENAFRFLRDSSEQARAAFSQQLLPTRLTRQKRDAALYAYASALIGLAGLTGLANAWGVARLVLAGGGALLPGPDGLPVIGLALLALPLTLLLAWQGFGVLRGVARFSRPLIRASAFLALLVLIGAWLAAHALPPSLAGIEQALTLPDSLGGPSAWLVLLAVAGILRGPLLPRSRDHVLGMAPLALPRTVLFGIAILIPLLVLWLGRA